MRWNDYVLRRRINVEEWLMSRSISTKEDFFRAISIIGVTPPAEEELLAMFPIHKEIRKDGTEPGQIEERDTPAPRGVVGTGNDEGLHSDGKSGAKFRGKRA